MLMLSSSLLWSWIFSCPQQIILIGGGIFWSFFLILNQNIEYFWSFSDFLSIILIFLTIYLLIFMKLMSKSSKILAFLMILLTVDLILTFLVDNILLFYIFFEFSLIPMSLMILGWGFQPERLSATLYMLFYTITTAFPFLGILILFNFPKFSELPFYIFPINTLMSFLIILPFLVKLPIFMAHLWLPKAHVEAPSYGSMVLAGVLLKLGGFGVWRLYPLMSQSNLILGIFSVTGAAICSIFVNSQTDVKAMIAYSSIVHMGLIAFCLILGTPLSTAASLMMMIAHGVCSSGLFCLITLSYQRMSTRSIVISQGMLSFLPTMCLFISLLLLMNLSAPPSLNLLSEVSMIYCILSWDYFSLSAIAILILFSLIYSLVLFYSYFHGPKSSYFATSPESKKEISLSFFHSVWWALSPLIMWLFEFY